MSNDYSRANGHSWHRLGCSIEHLDERLSGFVAAAEEEYVRMMLGQHVYSRGQDIKVYRLSLLIKHAFGGRLATEGQISALFQTTTTESRSLLRTVRAKFQYELRKATHDTMAAGVRASDQGRRCRYVVIGVRLGGRHRSPQ
jgi:hypothetical protein